MHCLLYWMCPADCVIYGSGPCESSTAGLDTVSDAVLQFIAGRLVAGFGVGFISAIIILYLSEIAPRKVRGAIGKCHLSVS